TPDEDTTQQLTQLKQQLDSIAGSQAHADQTTQAASNTLEDISFSIPDTIDPGMFDLLKAEMENNINILSQGILVLEENPDDIRQLEKLMRSSHSIKGAARMVNIDTVVKLAHAMEDCFVAAQSLKIRIDEKCTDIIFQSIDLLKQISSLAANEIAPWTSRNSQLVASAIHRLHELRDSKLMNDVSAPSQDSAMQQMPVNTTGPTHENPSPAATAVVDKKTVTDSTVRVSSKRINRLMGLAGELSVTSGWIRHHTDSMLTLKKKHNEMLDSIDRLRTVLEQHKLTDLEHNLIESLQHRAEQYRDSLSSQLLNLDEFDRRSNTLTSNLNQEIISSRMRPFSDGTQGYKRMVRDMARSLNKKIRLEIMGETTQVDREILEKIDAPINHMIRNAIDHGIELPEERIKAGKTETGIIKLEASHNAGQLLITVSDDGRGVDIETIRKKVLDKKLVNKAMADKLSKSELLDFLFLPAFSTRDQVTEISGRGVGLDVVHDTLQELRGKVHSSTELGKGMQISMILPLTLSVIRSLMVKVNNELYAFPLASIHNLVKIFKSDISILEDKQYITLDDQHIGLIHCAQILGFQNAYSGDELSIVIIGDWQNLYGVVVDEMLGERALALRPLNSRLGKIKDISAAALTNEGEPVLILDTDDLIASIKDIISGKDIIKVTQSQQSTDSPIKRVLVVDDSLTVREVEKKLIESRGYLVDVAVDGVDAWNTVRGGHYDLVVTDVDMPRMNGIELVSLIKADAALRSTPVMMVSYKDRPEDKQKGLEAGADYYLTKGSFHDETLIDAVRDLIGEAS
ncbi:MAG TPA: hybrid sensor histidine kinase/response regulator, partial [Gammaproteobacteria bacterium]